jgi:hypothetical protein
MKGVSSSFSRSWGVEVDVTEKARAAFLSFFFIDVK